jgi:hypothetical protein
MSDPLCKLLRVEVRPYVVKALAEPHTATCTSFRLVSHKETSALPEDCLRSCGTTERVLRACVVLGELDAFLVKYDSAEAPPHEIADVQYTAPEILCGETSYYGGVLVSCSKTREPHKWHIAVVSSLQDAMVDRVVNRARWQSGDAEASPIAADTKRSG